MGIAEICSGSRVGRDRIQTFEALRQDKSDPTSKSGQSIDIRWDAFAHQSPTKRISKVIAVLGHQTVLIGHELPFQLIKSRIQELLIVNDSHQK